MSLILGMDVWVFAAWILTIIAAIACVMYGIYYEYLKKNDEEKPLTKKDEKQKEEER